MAVKHITQRIDDVNGTILGEDATTIQFVFEGTRYEIDLSESNADRLRDAIKPYIEAARPVEEASTAARPGTATRRRRPREDSVAIREWARDNHFEVAEKGRISVDVIAAYNADHHVGS